MFVRVNEVFEKLKVCVNQFVNEILQLFLFSCLCCPIYNLFDKQSILPPNLNIDYKTNNIQTTKQNRSNKTNTTMQQKQTTVCTLDVKIILNHVQQFIYLI